MYILICQFGMTDFDIYLKIDVYMQIKNHQLYELYLCYLDSKNLSKGARALSEISESYFYEFLKRYEFNPGFKEKWEKKLLENKRQNNIEIILDNGNTVRDLFENSNENVLSQPDEDFAIYFNDTDSKTYKSSIKTDDNFFDF